MSNSFSILDALAEFGANKNFNTNTDVADYLKQLSQTTAEQNLLINDTRELRLGDIFCAVIGSQQDGREYIDDAILQGALLVVAECQNAQQHGNVLWRKATNSSLKLNQANKQIAIVQFYQLNRLLFSFAKSYNLQPQKNMSMIGITGTNGKTSTSQLIAKLLDATKRSAAVIGTNGAGRIEQLTPLNNTTPGATQLTHLLAKFANEGISHVAMEVSSHALDQRRVTADLFNIAIFTNLSRDHLDYHQTMENYAQAKRAIFTGEVEQIAIVNGDDAMAQQWLNDWPEMQSVIVYGRSFDQDEHQQYVKANNIKHHQTGVRFLLSTHLGDIEINSPLMADFNIDNVLAAIAVLIAEKVSLDDISHSVASLAPIIGRMETFTAPNMSTAIVDYAHTPDALENALKACRLHCNGDLWVVFGCGGDRDKGKRALMGEIAEKFADHIVITNDNPRSEAPEMIASDILSGCRVAEKVTIMLERKQAVLSTLAHAKTNDFILLAGKGHEDYIIIGDKKIAYNERDIVSSFFKSESTL